jgi:glycosyltransferase involved in cell wall biosynthesis
MATSALSLPGHAAPLARVEEADPAVRDSSPLPVSVIVAAKNEARNLPRCLESLRAFDEVLVIDSQSTDSTVEIARALGANVVQFFYRGGWPKKRQWALDNLPLRHDWVLLLDADESLTPELISEIRQVITVPDADGYFIGLDMFFLGRRLRHSGASFYKLCLFKRGAGRFECRNADQDSSMGDMEVHEHVMVRGPVRHLRNKLLHCNVESLSRYILKHNEYSNWEARVWRTNWETHHGVLQPAFFGSQAQRRRWLRKQFFHWPGSPLLFFFYKYLLCGGFLDGVPGLIYCCFQGIQFFHIKAKLYETKVCKSISSQGELSSEGDRHVRN